MNYLEVEKEIYMFIAKHLIEGEAIEFSTFSPTAYYLPNGSKAFAFPEKTMVVFKPRLIWDSQSRLKMKLEKKECDINKLVVIYDEVVEGVNPTLKDGIMKTISYTDFFHQAKNNMANNLSCKDDAVVPNDAYTFSITLADELRKEITVFTPPMDENQEELVQEQYFTQERIDELKEQIIKQIRESKNPFDIYCTDVDGNYRVTKGQLFYPEKQNKKKKK